MFCSIESTGLVSEPVRFSMLLGHVFGFVLPTSGECWRRLELLLGVLPCPEAVDAATTLMQAGTKNISVRDPVRNHSGEIYGQRGDSTKLCAGRELSE